MGQRNVFQNREKERAVDGRTEGSNHAKGARAGGALWHEREDPESLLTGPLALPANPNSVLPLLSPGYLSSSGYPLNSPSPVRHEPQESLCPFQRKDCFDQERGSE